MTSSSWAEAPPDSLPLLHLVAHVAAAAHIQNFVTRDGIAPNEFRRIGRQQLEAYGSVETRDDMVAEISGERGRFRARFAMGNNVEARRVLLCTGMIDEMIDIDGFRELWGKSIFQCPYCHGWESQNRSFGLLALSVELLDFAIVLRGWTNRVVVLTDGRFAVPPEVDARLKS